MTDLLESLNPVQRKAVQHTEGPLLILSGAGSGKTRVITHRIAHLIHHHRVSPYNILAVTFTNKAAEEMRTRLENLIGYSELWVATFHSTCAQILRRDIHHLGYERSFTIYDTSDQQTLIKELIKTLQLQLNSPGAVIGEISRAKSDFVSPEEYAKRAIGFFETSVAQIYPMYQDFLRENNALDFDDLIKLTVELFDDNPNVLDYYQEKFRYILVDEYQDTNRGQYLLVHALAQKHQNICVVGDDDQSIYSFRGADINNILDFEEDYPDTTVLRLVQNYRSTKNILEAAYHVIRNNQKRKEKQIWTDNKRGSAITLHEATEDIREADYVLRQIREWRGRGRKYGDCVIFYRINAQSRTFEDALRGANVPYQIVGGIRFYERMEVKDIMAYMRVIVNPADTVSIKRIINVPRRGIGVATVQKIEDFAYDEGIPLFEAIRRVGEVSTLNNGAKNRVREFAELIASFKPDDPPSRTAADLIDRSGYLQTLRSEGSIEAQTREENLQELVAAVTEYEESETEPTLSGFLEKITLASDIDSMEDKSDVVTMMTLHSAKGLEFPIVFMVGIEEGLLPHQRSYDSEAELEEERRLCYVGLTRAQEHVYLTYARSRRLYRDIDYRIPSRFIEEIPPELVEQGTPYESPRRPVVSSYDPDEPDYEDEVSFPYNVGDVVHHSKFGRGKVIAIDGYGFEMRITVRFERGSEKTLAAAHARLQRVG
ncbi:DNA helicase PcrA [Candidatus Poribacteria bacterium]|nr:MAG: DNA helicase PcrA [Candidatus Poribacteria bacterium]